MLDSVEQRTVKSAALADPTRRVILDRLQEHRALWVQRLDRLDTYLQTIRNTPR